METKEVTINDFNPLYLAIGHTNNGSHWDYLCANEQAIDDAIESVATNSYHAAMDMQNCNSLNFKEYYEIYGGEPNNIIIYDFKDYSDDYPTLFCKIKIDKNDKSMIRDWNGQEIDFTKPFHVGLVTKDDVCYPYIYPTKEDRDKDLYEQYKDTYEIYHSDWWNGKNPFPLLSESEFIERAKHKGVVFGVNFDYDDNEVIDIVDEDDKWRFCDEFYAFDDINSI